MLPGGGIGGGAGDGPPAGGAICGITILTVVFPREAGDRGCLAATPMERNLLSRDASTSGRYPAIQHLKLVDGPSQDRAARVGIMAD